jgi:predicted transcriptional regulator
MMVMARMEKRNSNSEGSFSGDLIDTMQVWPLAKQYPKHEDPFSNKNRTRFAIVSQLLEIARDECLKTHLIYRANLSFYGVTKYLDVLLSQGLLTECPAKDSANKRFKTSARGLEFLNLYYTLEKLLVSDSKPS